MQREGSCCNHWEWHWCGHEVLRCRSQHCKGQPDVWEWNFIGWAHRDYFESAGWWCSLQKNWMDGGHKPHSYIKYSAFMQSCTQLLSNAWVECQKSYKKHFYFQYSDKYLINVYKLFIIYLKHINTWFLLFLYYTKCWYFFYPFIRTLPSISPGCQYWLYMDKEKQNSRKISTMLLDNNYYWKYSYDINEYKIYVISIFSISLTQ